MACARVSRFVVIDAVPASSAAVLSASMGPLTMIDELPVMESVLTVRSSRTRLDAAAGLVALSWIEALLVRDNVAF